MSQKGSSKSERAEQSTFKKVPVLKQALDKARSGFRGTDQPVQAGWIIESAQKLSRRGC